MLEENDDCLLGLLLGKIEGYICIRRLQAVCCTTLRAARFDSCRVMLRAAYFEMLGDAYCVRVRAT